MTKTRTIGQLLLEKQLVDILVVVVSMMKIKNFWRNVPKCEKKIAVCLFFVTKPIPRGIG